MKDYHNVKQNLLDFKNDYKQLKIINRKIPRNTDFFFKKVFKCLNSVSGFVKYNSSIQDLGELLNRIITKDIKCDPFYRVWLDDMSNLCKLFCKFIGTIFLKIFKRLSFSRLRINSLGKSEFNKFKPFIAAPFSEIKGKFEPNS